jgi:hypothetical protein
MRAACAKENLNLATAAVAKADASLQDVNRGITFRNGSKAAAD